MAARSSAARPLLTPPLDRPLLARHGVVGCIIVAASAGIVVLGARYAGAHRAGRIDAAVDARVRHHLSGHLDFLHFLVSLADPASVIAACAALACLFFFTGRRRAALLAVLGPPAAAGFTEFVLKPLIDRRLADSLSFPSGHTTAAVSVAMVVVVALLGPSQPGWPRPARWGLAALALLGAAAVATALVGSGYHYATDTVGGFCVAAASVLAVAWIIDLLAHRRREDAGPYEGENREFTRTR